MFPHIKNNDSKPEPTTQTIEKALQPVAQVLQRFAHVKIGAASSCIKQKHLS